jgi:glycosyltransferase involved in cell wall biosynthesis
MSSARRPALAILGCRGMPARHGGFETFAERLSVHLVGRGWDVEVYCHDGADETGPEELHGVRLRRLRIAQPGPLGTLVFDWRALREAVAGPPRLLLTLGYNSAVFAALSRLSHRVNLANMDGHEYRRAKWSRPVRAWFLLNEILACRLHNHIIADHPAIADHLAKRVARDHITTIPYGADRVDHADPGGLAAFGLAPSGYLLAVSRPEPENSLLEIVRAFSRRPRGVKLVVLGRVAATNNAYQRAVLEAASEEVMFPGAIYAPDVLAMLRLHCRLYLHGHQVGGTNPSLVEAMGAGSAVLAHDNQFNRWVAGPGAAYFASEIACAEEMDRLLAAPPETLRAMREASRERHAAAFTWKHALTRYEALLLDWWQRV